jgi:hypothetical protein
MNASSQIDAIRTVLNNISAITPDFEPMNITTHRGMQDIAAGPGKGSKLIAKFNTLEDAEIWMQLIHGQAEIYKPSTVHVISEIHAVSVALKGSNIPIVRWWIAEDLAKSGNFWEA